MTDMGSVAERPLSRLFVETGQSAVGSEPDEPYGLNGVGSRMSVLGLPTLKS